MDKVNGTNGSVFRVDGRKVYCDGHPELPLKEGFLIGEGMAMFGYHRAPKYIVNLETNEVKQLVFLKRDNRSHSIHYRPLYMKSMLEVEKYLYICLFALCIIISQRAEGQELDDIVYNQIVVKADSVAQLGQNYRISYQYNCKDSLEEITAPQWNWNNQNYNLLAGPSKSMESTYYFSNGKLKPIQRVTFTFELEFTRVGVFDLPPMTVKLTNGNTITSKSVTVNVSSTSSNIHERELLAENTSKGNLLVIETKLNKHTINLGDSIDCEIRLYTDMNVYEIYAQSLLPIRNAYWEIHDFLKEMSFEKVEYNGALINSALLAKYSIIPMQSGNIVIDPMAFSVVHCTPNPDIDPVEAFYNGKDASIYNDTIIKTNKLEIEVSDAMILPDNLIVNSSTLKYNKGIIIDYSSSLLASVDSISPSFLDLEKMFLTQLLKEKVFDKPSITLFAGRPHYPTTKELSNLQNISSSKDNDGSAIYDAVLASALHEGALTTYDHQFSIILLTDGSDNASHLSEATLVSILKQNNIRVDIVAFASNKDSVYYNFGDSIGVIKIANRQNLNDVERIAKATNGIFMVIENEKQISQAIRKLKEQGGKKPPMKTPSNEFCLEKGMLYRLYESIIKSSETEF